MSTRGIAGRTYCGSWRPIPRVDHSWWTTERVVCIREPNHPGWHRNSEWTWTTRDNQPRRRGRSQS